MRYCRAKYGTNEYFTSYQLQQERISWSSQNTQTSPFAIHIPTSFTHKLKNMFIFTFTVVLCQVPKPVLRCFKTAIKNGYALLFWWIHWIFLDHPTLLWSCRTLIKPMGRLNAWLRLFTYIGFILYSPVVNIPNQWTRRQVDHTSWKPSNFPGKNTFEKFGERLVGWLNTAFIQCRKRSWRNSFWAAIIFSGRSRVLCGK